MTNRTSYMVFTKFDDPTIQEFVKGGGKAILIISDIPFELIIREGSLGVSCTVESVFAKTQDLLNFTGFLNRDHPDLKAFLNRAQIYINDAKLKRAERLADLLIFSNL